MPSEFTYKPLAGPDGIRLIELHPALDAFAALQCSLIHTALSICDNGDIFGHYTTLSYVWGCPNKTSTIWIDGTPLLITQNLFTALQDLRDKTRTLLLWADGICINQSDIEEKSMQVGLMRRIYSGSSNTVIYLGSTNLNSPEFKCLSVIDMGQLATAVDKELLLDSILSKEWFTRVWVLQELVLSKNPWIQCGTARTKWVRFYNALTQRPEDETPTNERYKVILEMQRARTANCRLSEDSELHLGELSERDRRVDTARNTMLELLLARRCMGVSDARDMVFAHAGFASDSVHEDLTIDYTRTCPRVYMDCARYIGKVHGLTTLLTHACESKPSGSKGIKDLASWVPDWTHLLSLTPVSMDRYRDADELSINPIFVQRGEILAAILRTSDTVLFTSSTLSLKDIPEDIRQSISSIVLKLPSGLELSDWYLMLTMGGNKEEVDCVDEVWSAVYPFLRKLIQDDDILPEEPANLYHSLWSNFRYLTVYMAPWFLLLLFHPTATIKCADGMLLAKMASGGLALVPPSTRRGDTIASPSIASGGHALEPKKFVFRPHQHVRDGEGLDTEILAAMDPPPQDFIKWNKIQDDKIDVRELSILHCKLLGECFSDVPQETVKSSEEPWFQWAPSNPVIMALH
jgi:hypothetical protein